MIPIAGHAAQFMPTESVMLELNVFSRSVERRFLGRWKHLWVSGRVARPFGSALTDPGRRLSRTRLFPRVTRMASRRASRGE
jgi:hypothetical protein